MIIEYANGKTIEGVALSMTENTMRVALQGHDDVIELVRVQGHWVSEDCEPVRILPSWRANRPRPAVEEADCVCSQDLAARLVRMLLNGSENDEPVAEYPAAKVPAVAASCRLM